MARKRRRSRKKKKFGRFILFILLIWFSIFSGIKLGEYFANKLSKPIEQGDKAPGKTLEGIESGGKVSEVEMPSEDERVKQVSRILDFVAAEHKKTSSLADLATADYYKVLLQELDSIRVGTVNVKNIDFKESGTSQSIIEVQFNKNSKSYKESITMVREDTKWKVSGVVRE